MYNRYIPQPDGSFRRSRLPEQERQEHPRPSPQQVCPQEQPKPEPCKAPPGPPPCPHPRPQRPSQRSQRQEAPCSGGKGVGDFLHQLLPGDFDTSDLIVVLLLLLMAGDQPEERNTALLTLAIYLFL